ncbi:MAG: hypothetical protein ACOCXQ_01760 [Patescibacteria group bacterium]
MKIHINDTHPYRTALETKLATMQASPPLSRIVERYWDHIADIEAIEKRFNTVTKTPNYIAEDIDLISTARQYSGDLYGNLEEIIERVLTTEKDAIPTETEIIREFQSVYVITKNPSSNKKQEYVLSASDLDRNIFSKPITETVFIQNLNQLIASWLIFALTGNLNIFALAPMTHITALPNCTFSHYDNHNEYISIYFLLNKTPSFTQHIKAFRSQILPLAQALEEIQSPLTITFDGDLCQIMMRKTDMQTSPNYDITKGRMPIAKTSINLFLNNNVVLQTGFSSLPDNLQQHTHIKSLINALYTHTADSFTRILSEGMEIVTNDELFLPLTAVHTAQNKFRTVIRNELKNLHYEVHLWFHYFLRYLLNEHPLNSSQRRQISRLLDSENLSFKDITHALFYDLFLLSKQQKTVMKKMEQFTELLESYDKSTTLGRRKYLAIEQLIQDAIHSFPSMVISTQYVPQTLHFDVTVDSLYDPEVVAFELFPELTHYFLSMNAAKHNPNQSEVEIQIMVDLVSMSSRPEHIWTRIQYENVGSHAPNSVFQQLYEPKADRIISLPSSGSGISLKNALTLTCIQTKTPLSQAEDVFRVENTEDGFRVAYLLPVSRNFQQQLSPKEIDLIPTIT